MSVRPSFLIPKLVGAGKAGPGLALSKITGGMIASRQIVKREKDKTESVVDEQADTRPINGNIGEDGLVGMSLGITLPGPKNSYMAARIDVICYLPTHTKTDEQVKRTFKRVEDLVQEELEKQVDEAKQALGIT